MKFLTSFLITAITLSTSVFSAPVPDQTLGKKQVSGPISVIGSALSTLQSDLTEGLNTISSTVSSVQAGSITPTVAESAITSALSEIEAAISAATTSINGAYPGIGSLGLDNLLQGLTGTDVDTLVSDLTTALQPTLDSLSAILTTLITDLDPVLGGATGGVESAVAGVVTQLNPLLAPLRSLVAGLYSGASPVGGLDTSGLSSVFNQLVSTATGLANSLGLGSVLSIVGL